MASKAFRLMLFIGFPLVVFCLIFLLFAVAGVHFESGKLKNMVFMTAFVLIFQYIIADPIKFVLQALWETFVEKDPRVNNFRYGIPRAANEKDDIRFFKMRVEWNKSRLTYDWRHRDEELNVFYKTVASDLSVFGRYFISLVILVVILNEPLSFYHSDGLRKVFSVVESSGREVEIFEGLHHFEKFLNENLTELFQSENGTETNWVPDGANKLLGVVRLEQVRLQHRQLGLNEYYFSHEKYFPGWTPYKNYPYQMKYWRTYDPWKPTNKKEVMHYTNEGYLSDYPSEKNYVAYLARYKVNTRKIIEFLLNNDWLNRLTAILFIDFTVYNIDANLFSLCRIHAEYTQFGSLIMHLRFSSVPFLLNWDYTSNWYWLALLVYMIQWILLVKVFVVKVWYGSLASLLKFWNILDFFMIVANVLIFVFIYLRESTVIQLVSQFRTASKEQYINFQTPYVYGHVAEILLAVLIFCATIRLWKVLLFARVFRLYVRTLQLGAVDIFWALVNIMIFLIGLMISSYTINGARRTQDKVPLSLVHILSFCLGYSERVNPMEERSALGLIIYALMMFGVTLILLNMLITLICIHYSQAKDEERQRPMAKVTFWEFLVVEYSYPFRFFYKLKKVLERKLKGTFIEKLHEKYKEEKNKQRIRTSRTESKQTSNDRQAIRLRRIQIMTDILLTQAEIVNRQLKELDISSKTDNNVRNQS